MKSRQFLLAALLLAVLSPAAEADLADATHDVKQTTVDAAKKTGQAAREAAHATASAARAVGHDVASSARDGYQAAKRATKRAVHKTE